MNGVFNAVRWFLAAAILLAMPIMPAFADRPVASKVIDKPTNIPPVPRGMPDLTPYHAFDPPKSPLFDINKLTVSGDMRVRPEVRTNSNFGVSQGAIPGRVGGANDFYVQQWMRLGLSYAISPDVDVFFQPQWAKNWGAANNTVFGGAGCGAGGTICANDPFNVGQADSLFVRQAFIMIRNLGVQNLSLKAGRQMIVMGNHRLFGHFDWANTGFTHDGVTLQYAQPTWEFWGGWLRPMEQDFNFAFTQSTSFGVLPQGCPTSCIMKASSDADLFFARFVFKPIAGLSFEPLWVYFINNAPAAVSNGSGAGVLAAHANSQNRHNIGARLAYRQGPFDGTVEGYYQFGAMSSGLSVGERDLHISAYALAAEAGVTLAAVPWTPRIGVEFNYASGDGDALRCNSTNGAAACHGTANTFENFYPTNHIVMGYADVMAWRNMVAYSGSVQVKPTEASHFEFRYWNFRKANRGDCWYRAAQNCYYAVDNGSSHLTDEIDFIYTLFFKNNKVAWQIGGSYLFATDFLDKQAGAGNQAVNQVWGYTQLHVNF